MIRVGYNDTYYDIKDGLIRTDNLNNTLDSVIAVAEDVYRLDLQPFDELDVLINGDSRKYVIIDIQETISTYEPLKYNYTFQLASPLILLERITLPDLSIKRVYKSTNNEFYLKIENGKFSRTVAYYINQYVREYSNFKIDADLLNVTSRIICPELTFNQPNLREVLITLLSTADLLLDMYYNPTDSSYYLTYINPNKRGKEIDTSKLNTDTINYNANYYASNLDTQLKNAIPNEIVKSVQLTPRTEEAILTTDNARLILDEPIYDIYKLEINLGLIEFENASGDALQSLGWVDITDDIVEKEVYDSSLVESKMSTLYFKRGDNKIYGLGETFKIYNVLNSNPAITTIVQRALAKIGGDYFISQNLDKISKAFEKNFFDVFYRITYQPQQGIRFFTEKTKKQKHLSTLFNKQENNYVNVELFGKNALDTLNRIGNAERTITAVYNDISEVPVVSDYIDDYILTQRTISVYDNYVVFEGKMTKDFSYKYQYNALNTEKRYFKISDEAVVRHEVITRYYVFDFIPNGTNYPTLSENILKFKDLSCKYATITPEFLSSSENENANTILSEVCSYKVGNSVVMSFGFNNNIYAGHTRGDKDTGGYYQEPVKYTDSYGENIGVDIELYNDIPNKTFSTAESYLNYSNNILSKLPLLEDAFSFFVSSPIFTFNSKKHKDQSEVQKWTIQHIMVSNHETIIIGDEWYNINAIIDGSKTLSDLKVITYDDRFRIGEELNSEYITEIGSADDTDIFEVYGMGIKFKLTGNVGLAYNNKLVLGINDYYISEKLIYLNIKNNR